MATIAITVPDLVVTRVQTAFVARYGDDPAYAGLTPTQVAKKAVAIFIRGIVTEYEVAAAITTAQATTLAQDTTDFGGIT